MCTERSHKRGYVTLHVINSPADCQSVKFDHMFNGVSFPFPYALINGKDAFNYIESILYCNRKAENVVKITPEKQSKNKHVRSYLVEFNEYYSSACMVCNECVKDYFGEPEDE